MITTGVRTSVGIKVLGADLNTIEKIGVELERVLKDVPGTRSAFFERVTGGYYLDFQVKREEAARYDLSVNDVNDIIESAIGGKNITTTIEGRERYPVNVRYARELRDTLPKLSRILVPTPTGAQVPIKIRHDRIHSRQGGRICLHLRDEYAPGKDDRGAGEGRFAGSSCGRGEAEGRKSSPEGRGAGSCGRGENAGRIPDAKREAPSPDRESRSDRARIQTG